MTTIFQTTVEELDESFLESGIAAPLGIDGCGQGARGLAATGGLHAVPEERVVPDLRGVVVDAAAGLLDDFFQRHALELGALLQVVQVHDVGVVVLAVVELKRFLAVVRGERVDGVDSFMMLAPGVSGLAFRLELPGAATFA